MDLNALLHSPIAAVRAFAAIVPAILEEDREGAQAALHAATYLSSGLQRWSNYPFEPADAAYFRACQLFHRRASQTALTARDIRMLGTLCNRAIAIPFHDTDGKTPQSLAFNEHHDFITSSWHQLESR